MAYPKDIKAIMDKIPKEHHKDINKIIHHYYSLGVTTTQALVKDIARIPVNKIIEYVVCNEDELAGG